MTGRIIFGGFLILLGVGFLLDQFNILNFGFFLGNFWALIIIVLGLYLIIRHPRNILPGVFILFIGILFQVESLDLLQFSVWNLWPLILVFVGISILIKREDRKDSAERGKISDDNIDLNAVFAGIEKSVDSDNFKGGNISAVFGAAKLDLRDAKFSKDGATINADAIFGGIEIFLPDNVRVINNGTAVLGEFKNSSRRSASEDSPILTVQGSAVLGEVSVK